MEEIKFVFKLFDRFHKVGIAWKMPNGKREALFVKIPDEKALRLFKITHPDCNSFEDD